MTAFLGSLVVGASALHRTRRGARYNHALGPTPGSTGTTSPFASDAVERLLTELHGVTSTRPPWVVMREQPLAEAEVIQLARHTLLWFCVGLGSAVLVVWSGIATFARAD